MGWRTRHRQAAVAAPLPDTLKRARRLGARSVSAYSLATTSGLMLATVWSSYYEQKGE